MDTLDIIKRLSEPFPREAIRQRQGGGGTRFDYIAGPDIIRRLTRATGGHWDWVIKSFEFRPLPAARSGAEQSLVVVMGELTIPGLGTRAGIGVQKVSESAGEDLVKGASTDALKKAATLFGVALELYGPDFEEDRADYAAAAPAPPRRAEAVRPTPAPTVRQEPAEAQSVALRPMTYAEFVAFFEEQASDFRNGTERPYILEKIRAERARFSETQHKAALEWWTAFTANDEPGMAAALLLAAPVAPSYASIAG